jgi:hypothetical protein
MPESESVVQLPSRQGRDRDLSLAQSAFAADRAPQITKLVPLNTIPTGSYDTLIASSLSAAIRR